MKTIKNVVQIALVFCLLFSATVYSQEDEKEEFKPVFITLTTLHQTSDPDVDFSDWLETEQEYHARTAYFGKRNSYYDDMHSDEIMTSWHFQVDVMTESTEPLIYYVKKNIRGNGDGSGFKEYFENVTSKNKYVKGYYTHGHRYGANSRDAHEVFVFENFSDIEKAFDEDDRLVKEHWPDEEKRKEFFEGYSKIFAGHGDAIYQNVPELKK